MCGRKFFLQYGLLELTKNNMNGHRLPVFFLSAEIAEILTRGKIGVGKQ